MQKIIAKQEDVIECFEYRFLPSIWHRLSFLLMLLLDLTYHLRENNLSLPFITVMVIFPLAANNCLKMFCNVSWLFAFCIAFIASFVGVAYFTDFVPECSLAGVICLLFCLLIGRLRVQKLNEGHNAKAWLPSFKTRILTIALVALLIQIYGNNPGALVSIGIAFLIALVLGNRMPVRGGSELHISADSKPTVQSVKFNRDGSFKSIIYSVTDFDDTKHIVLERTTFFGPNKKQVCSFDSLEGDDDERAERAFRIGSLIFFADTDQALGEPATAYRSLEEKKKSRFLEIRF